MGVAGGVNLFHAIKQMPPCWTNLIKISHAENTTNYLEVNDNFIKQQIKLKKLQKTIIVELNLVCIARK